MRGRYQSGRYQSDGSDPYGIGTANCEVAANMLIGLTNQVTYLLKHQIEKLEREFVEQGGFTNHLCQANSKFKRMSDRSDPSDSPGKPAPPPDCPHCGARGFPQAHGPAVPQAGTRRKCYPDFNPPQLPRKAKRPLSYPIDGGGLARPGSTRRSRL